MPGYVEQGRRRSFSSKIAGHTSILWITGRVIVAMGVCGYESAVFAATFRIAVNRP
jgi:hypothetical protein